MFAMEFTITLNVIHGREILNPIIVQSVVGLTTLIMVIRFVLDALRHRTTGHTMKMTLIVMDAVTHAMILYSLGIMQRPSDKDYYYKVWAVLLVTLRYSVKIGRPSGITLKQTPLVDLMSSFWAANILRSKAPKILKVTGWLLWSVNSLRIIHGFVSSEFANDSHRENMRLLTEYMRHEHKAGAGCDGESLEPSTMTGYRYLVQGESETKKRKMKKKGTSGQEMYVGMVEEIKDIRRLLLALRDGDKEILTLEKIWKEPGLEEELKDLCLSFALYKLLRRRFFNFSVHEANLKRTRRLVLDGILGEPCNSERAFRVSEAEVSFLNDFFNSRHAIVFAKGFPLLRLLLSTILIGGIGGMAFAIYSFSKVGTKDELGNVHGGVVFTWFLLSFLFIKEIWEITTYVFSDWTKIILLCKYVEKPWWLRNWVTKALVRKLCRISVLPRWHGKVGQCNLLFPTSRFSTRSSMYFVDLSSEVKRTVINCLRDCLDKHIPRLDNYLERAFNKVDRFCKDNTGAVNGVAENLEQAFDQVRGAVNGLEDCVHILLVWHIATCYCEIQLAKRRNVRAGMFSSGQAFGRRKASEGMADLQWSQYMIARTLSQYCAYVLTLVPPLVPGNSLMARSVLEKVCQEKRSLLLKRRFPYTRCSLSTHILERLTKYASGSLAMKLFDEEKLDDTILKKGAILGKKLTEEFCDDILWMFLSEFWAGFVIHMAADTRASQHKNYLSSGGELMTHLWALLTHAGILGSVQHGDQDIDTALTQGDPFDPNVQS